MNEQQLRQSVVSIAKSWLGRKESDGTHKPIIDLYNSYLPHPRGYKMTYTDSWCAATPSAIAIQLGLTNIIPVECSCGALINLYKAHPDSQWEENDAFVPDVADMVFYDWNDNGVGDNTGAPEHVGIVSEVNGNTMIVIEGNYANSVKKRTLAVNGRYIRGYGRPAYWVAAQSDNLDFADKVIASAVSYGIIENADSAFSSVTKKDVFIMLKRAIDTGWINDGAPLVDDPSEPPQAPPDEQPQLNAGSKGDAVKTLQTKLNALGYAVGAVDGDFGPKTEAAVKAFQRAHRLSVDGIVGPLTWAALYASDEPTEYPATRLVSNMPAIISKDILPISQPGTSLSEIPNSTSGSFFSSFKDVKKGIYYAPVSICIAKNAVYRNVSCHYYDGEGYPESVIYRLDDGRFGIKRVKNVLDLPPNVSWAVGGLGLLDNYDPPAEGFKKIGSIDFSDVLRDTNHILFGIKDNLTYQMYCKSMTAQQVNAKAKEIGFDMAIMLDGGHVAGINGSEDYAKINRSIIQYYVIKAM